MKDDIKTKKQLIEELAELRLQNAALNQSTTEGISAGLAIEEARRYAESIVETIREPLLVLDADLKIISANRNFYKAFKVTSVETIGSFIYDLGNKQWDIPKLRELLEEVLPEKQAFNDFEVKHNFEDIGQKIMLLNARHIHQEYIDAKIILLAIEDITERKLVEEKLRIAAIVESSKDAIIGKSLDGIITSWDKGAEEIYGYTKSEIIGKSVSVLIPPELPDEMAEILEKIKSGEGIKNYETVRQRKDGQDIYVSMTVSAIHDAEGRILGASIVARDITERNRLEHLLEESEMQYRLLFETANDGIVLLEKNEGKIVHVNPSVEKMLGYSAKESIGNKLQNVGLIIDNGDFQITMKNLNEKGILRYYDVPVKTKSGHHIYADTYIVDKAKFALCNIRDINELHAEELLSEIREDEPRTGEDY
jgi:PAS domain S-box-containing protein